MSKTPRTDSELKLEAFMDGFGIVDTVQVEFAAQLETELNTVQKNLDGLATEVGHALVLCSVDFAGGESVEPREHAIWVAVRKLISQRDEARAIVAQQKKTFVAALQNATKLSASQLRIAEQLKSESSPEMLESERAANATLTQELEKACVEIERLQARDGSAKIHLLTPTREDPFRRETLKKVDFGVADNCYVVESETLQRKDALIQQMRQALEWALTEARSTHGETLIQDALAAERKSQT